MSDNVDPRHVALERRLLADGWKRYPVGDTETTHFWSVVTERGVFDADTPLRPDFADYDKRCDEVEVEMARARGESWDSAIARAERAEAERDRALSLSAAYREALDTASQERDALHAEVERLNRYLARQQSPHRLVAVEVERLRRESNEEP